MNKVKLVLLNLVIITYVVTVAGWMFNNVYMFYCGFGVFTAVLVAFIIMAVVNPGNRKPHDDYDADDELADMRDIREKYENDEIRQENGNDEEDKGKNDEDIDKNEDENEDEDREKSEEEDDNEELTELKASESEEEPKETLEQISERFRRANSDKGGDIDSDEKSTEDIDDKVSEDNDNILKSDDNDELKNNVEEIVVYRMEIGDLKKELEKVSEELESAKRELYEYKSHGEISGDNSMSILPGEIIPKSELDTINIVDIAKNVAEELHTEAIKAGLRVQVSAGEEQILVRADKELLRVLFRNIVDNSIKYMNRQGMLVITLSTIGDDLFVVLKDNGDGLDEEETNHIFELNYQGSNRISGNGLGLAQAKAVVEYYGGNIYAKSTPGGGMGIYIQLPTL